MTPGATYRSARFRVTLVLISIAITACQSNGVVETLDARSGLTIVTEKAPVIYARTLSQFSRSARDYLYLGPVEINERGVREYYLWIGMASTIDRAYLVVESSEPGLMILDVPGDPLEFELGAWDERVPRLAGREIYDPAVTPARVYSARVTHDQIALIASSKPERVLMLGEQTSPTEYFLWEEGPEWPSYSTDDPLTGSD